VTVDTRAVGSKSEKEQLFLSESHQGNHRLFQAEDAREGVAVDVVAIGDVFQNGECFDIVKIGVQAVEELVLAGMPQAMSRPENLTIVVEIVEDELAQGKSASEGSAFILTIETAALIDDEHGGVLYGLEEHTHVLPEDTNNE